MDGGAETPPLFWQTGADGPWVGIEPRQARKDRQPQAETVESTAPQFIEHIYFKRFKREEPETVKPLKQILKEMETKKKLQKEKKEERRKQRSLFSDSAAE